MTGVYDVSVLLRMCYSSAWFAGIACVFHLMYTFFRNHTYVTVNCWFCNVNLKVLYRNRNEWFCTHCHQFNGFNEDGDYSRPVPEQYNEKLNAKYLNVSKLNNNFNTRANGLCRVCNANQELKVKQLSLYVPFREENYNVEIELFRRQLEDSYRLCSSCENVVRKTLELKSTLVPPLIPTKVHENKGRNSFMDLLIFRKSIYILFIMTGLLTVLIWEQYPQNFHNFNFGSIAKSSMSSFNKLTVTLNQDRDSVFSLLLAICVASAAKNNLKSSKYLGSLFFGIIVFLMSDYLTFILKVFGVASFFVYSCFKHYKCRNLQVKRNRKFMDELDGPNSLKHNFEKKLFSVDHKMTADTPIRRKFSDLNLGNSNGFVSKSPKPSYLFKPSKRLIQPSKLKIDDIDYSTDSSQFALSANSGLESISNFLRKSPNNVSEFDSISQTGINYNDSYHRQSNAAVAHYFQYRSYLQTPERYFGVSPIYPPVNLSDSSVNTSQQVQVNACFSFLQILLCSIAFFILGFLLQIFVSKF